MTKRMKFLADLASEADSAEAIAPTLKPITSASPAQYAILIDGSGSMTPHAEKLRALIDQYLDEVTNRGCRKGGGSYLDIGVWTYSSEMRSLWSGALAGQDFVSATDIKANPAQVVEERQAGAYPVSFPRKSWLANAKFDFGATNMGAALAQVAQLFEQRRRERPHSNLILAHLSDGQPSDDPSEAIAKLRDLGVITLNAFYAESGTPQHFPETADCLPEGWPRKLFEMTSILPLEMRNLAQALEYAVSDQSRALMFNVHKASVLLDLLNIGTPPARS